MADLSVEQMIVRLGIAAVLGGLIGVERETHGRPAGLRTHILVCVGSALFALCSYSVAGTQWDPGRITAQIVTGMGFLGAGTIMRQGSVVRGLTTAASIWTVAAIGIAVAVGGRMLPVAGFATVLVVITLNLVPHLERSLLHTREDRVINIVTRRERGPVGCALGILSEHGVRVRVLGTEEGPEAGTQLLRARLQVPRDFDDSQLSTDLAAADGVLSYNWE